MSDAARKLAYSLHFLALAKLLLSRELARKIAARAD